MPGWVLTSRQASPAMPCAVVPAEIRAGDAAAAERAMRREREPLRLLVDVRRDRRRQEMRRAARRVFRLVIIEARGRHDLDHAERLVAHHRAGQFLAGDERLGQQHIAEFPVGAGQLLRRILVRLGDDEDAEAGAFADRLEHIRPLQHMLLAAA